MGMSTHVMGYISPEGDLYQKHKRVLMACKDAGIEEMPKETAEFFGGTYPEEWLLEEVLEVKIPVHECGGEMEDGLEVFVSEIPKNVHSIRFINSY